jgi:hypothetical protein
MDCPMHFHENTSDFHLFTTSLHLPTPTSLTQPITPLYFTLTNLFKSSDTLREELSSLLLLYRTCNVRTGRAKDLWDRCLSSVIFEATSSPRSVVARPFCCDSERLIIYHTYERAMPCPTRRFSTAANVQIVPQPYFVTRKDRTGRNS